MQGDFSNWRFRAGDNHAAVLHQQGKVLLDSDWNTAVRIQSHWRETLGRDAVGAFIAAVPAETPDGFKVAAATADGSSVRIELLPGRLWADGILVHRDPAGPASGPLLAEPLGLPFQTPPAPGSEAPGIRDAVILEVWEEALSAYQEPAHLLEPALGGPDTTERVQVAYGLKLLRLNAGQDCESLGPILQDDMGARGRLTVTPKPEVVLGSDCPVSAGGGYTGFEHFLYRIEIAEPEGGEARFKWSQFNGGLVGRGRFDSVAARVRITANDQMINHCGVDRFHLESLAFDADRGHWRIVFTAEATLAAPGELALTNPQGTWPAPASTAFFRLWNGVERVADFPLGLPEPRELKDGIRLEFQAPAADLSNYVPGNYWTFPVRAAGVPFDPSLWPADQPPEGARHRVPLAVLEWDAAPPATLTFPTGGIHDCRRPIHPLTRPCGCCYRVGDGRTSFGDFNSVEEALAHLPFKGGKLCLLGGIHRVSVLIRDRRNIFIEGCERQTLVIPARDRENSPIFRIADSQGIFIEKLDMLALANDAVLAKGSAPGKLKDIGVTRNRIVACRHAVAVAEGEDIRIDHNLIRMIDRPEGREAILCQADGGLIERNDIGTIPAGSTPPPEDTPDGETPDPSDPCAEAPRLYANLLYLPVYAMHLWALQPFLIAILQPYRTTGGIRIVGGSERIRILENRIAGGAGNGITLGGGFPKAREPEQPEPETPQRFILRNGRESVFGRLVAGGVGASGLMIGLAPVQGGALRQAVSDSAGEFELKAPPGEYEAALISPGYRLREIRTDETPAGGPEHLIALEAFAAAPGDGGRDEVDPLELAFLHDITIESNEIGEMGLSGIGTHFAPPPSAGTGLLRASDGSRALAASVLVQAVGRFGGFAINLSIHRNRIRRCLRNSFDEALIERARNFGLGGISLGLCEHLAINENVIEANGRNHVNPVCGIFAAYANRADIVENRIINNGALDMQTEIPPQDGMRGGIVVRLAAAISLEEHLAEAQGGANGGLSNNIDSLALAARRTMPRGQYALRLLDNFVQHPVNRSVHVMAIGPLMAAGNFLHTDLAYSQADTALQGGVVLILNLGMPGTGGQRIALPGGQVRFGGNHVQLGLGSNCATALMLLSADDVGMDGNQGEVDQDIGLITHAAIWGSTVRAGGNRFQEPPAPEGTLRLSLLSLGNQLNNTTHNQGDHCTLALCLNASRPAVDIGNQVTGTGPRNCGTLNQMLNQALAKG